MKAVLINTFHLFALLGIIFIPSASYVLPFQDDLAIWVFGDLVNALIGDHLDFSSDSRGLNMLLIVLFLIASLAALSLNKIKFWKDNAQQIIAFIQIIMVYYLASKLLVYGFDKVFKTQFYMPEPNILYTPFGYLSKDILFWSVMGTSKWYCILSGIAEIVPAVFLLFKRTRVLGLLMLTLILLHVLTINIGFDISVKLYTLFLLFLVVLSLLPHIQPLFRFFLKREHVQLQEGAAIFKGKSHIKKGLKFFVVGMIFIEALKFPISSGYLSDDNVPRPDFHGAYTVFQLQNTDGDLIYVDHDIERFFIHRKGFFIFQYSDGSMKSHKMKLNKNEQVIELEGFEQSVNKIPYRLNYGTTAGLTIGIYMADYELVWVSGKREDLASLPALQDEFHWTIDEFKIEE